MTSAGRQASGRSLYPAISPDARFAAFHSNAPNLGSGGSVWQAYSRDRGPVCAPSDVNCDGVVGVSDLLAVINNWGPCPLDVYCTTDIWPIDGDGAVNVSDLLQIINNWG